MPIPSYINIEQMDDIFPKWRIIQGTKLNPVKFLKVKFLDETKMKMIRINEMHVFLLEGILPFLNKCKKQTNQNYSSLRDFQPLGNMPIFI
jgi:hypothetical protein